MTEREGLASSEGVDQGSAAQSAEGTGRSSDPALGVDDEVSAASPGPVAADVAPETAADRAGGDVLGEPAQRAPADSAQAAAPVDMELRESRAARDDHGTGQQYQVGEG